MKTRTGLTAITLLAAALTATAACTNTGATPTTITPETSPPFSIPAPDTAATQTSSTAASSDLTTDTSTPATTTQPSQTTPARSTRTPESATTATTTTTHTQTATTPNYGTAKPAVDAYLSLIAGYHRGLADPTHPPTKLIYKYSTGEGYNVIAGSIADEKAHGRAWRGTPDQSRVRVVTNKVNAVAPEVVLSDCPLPSKSWEEYDVKLGKAVPQPKQTPPPPYEATVLMFQLNGDWVMTSFKLDGTKTCTR